MSKKKSECFLKILWLKHFMKFRYLTARLSALGYLAYNTHTLIYTFRTFHQYVTLSVHIYLIERDDTLGTTKKNSFMS